MFYEFIIKSRLFNYSNDKLNCKDTREKFEAVIGGKFASLLKDEKHLQPNEFYNEFKAIIHKTADQEIGNRNKRNR